MASSAVDNDVLYKGVYYGLLRELLGTVPSSPDEVTILGQATFVIGNRLKKDVKKKLPNADAAASAFKQFMAEFAPAEPTENELLFAAALEKAAADAGVALDSGESLLCAVLVHRSLDHLVTGDKRAIAAIASLLEKEVGLKAVAGRVLCLEQLFRRLLDTADPPKVRAAVCSAAHADRALAICFSCTSPEVKGDKWKDSLERYIESTKTTAPDVLSRTIP